MADLNRHATLAAEDEHMAREWCLFKNGLYERRLSRPIARRAPGRKAVPISVGEQ
jgi:hypothetical protein